ncbi:MAG TPA: DUF4214 domain-containing protein [Pirellulales bacterium]|nr:DUF4214 domain-containing protein [Pirellulales bacterium]
MTRARRSAARRAPFCAIETLESRHMLTNVLNYHDDSSSTGANLNETVLTPANVNSSSFGQLATVPLDGQVYAEPLYVENVNISVGAQQGVHNVAFVATENDSVYAIDSTSGAVLWHTSFINPAQGITTVPNGDTLNVSISPQLGITATPVIDPTSNTLYVIANTKEIRADGTHYVYRLHALDLSTGAEKLGGPLLIGDTLDNNGNFTYLAGPSVKGTGDDSVNGIVTFNALHELERPGLSLTDGNVYLAFSSHADTTAGHGWIMSVNAQTMQLNGVLCTTPNGSQGGVWQDGDEVTTTGSGFYVSTGEGTFDSTLNAAGFPVNGDYGDSVIKFVYDPTTSPTNENANGWGLKIIDYFTPSNQAQLFTDDLDLGSGGVVLLPASAGTAAHPDLLVQGGKQGTVYLMDRDNLPGYQNASNYLPSELLQTAPGEVTSIFSTPAYFNGTLYYAGVGGTLEAFPLSNGTLATTPSSQSSQIFGYPGATPSISANGTANGIVWVVDLSNNELQAYDASNLSRELYSSPIGTAVKFSTPTIADGHVFVGTANSLVIFGPGGTNANATGAANEQYVAAAFQNVLQRPADTASLNAWTLLLDQGLPRATFALDLTHSAEYFQDVIKAAYEKFLGRAADPTGLAVWTQAMASGLTDEELEAAFIGSPEFYAHSGGTDLSWVDNMYQSLLGRPADASGEAYWTQALAAGVSRQEVAIGFAASPEREGQIVQNDYSLYLGRSAGTAEVAGWVARFEQGLTNEDVIAGFIASDEYYNDHDGS